MLRVRHAVLAIVSFFLLWSCADLSRQKEADDDSPPRPIKITRPEYPPEAKEDGIEGVVVVEITISAQGEVVDAIVVESVTGLDEAALSCVWDWEFEPAHKDGKPVSTTARVPITFALTGPKAPEDHGDRVVRSRHERAALTAA